MQKIRILISCLLTFSIFNIGADAEAVDANTCDIDASDINQIFAEYIEKTDALKVRIQQHQTRFANTWSLCQQSTKTLCHADDLTTYEKKTILNIVAQIDNPQVQKEILENLIPTAQANNNHYIDLLQYLDQLSKKCSPPRYDICDSNRFMSLFNEYFQRIETAAPHLTRASDAANFYATIPGLKTAITRARETPLPYMNNAGYVADLNANYSQGASSIILNQARKKTLNDVSKGFSDLVGAKGNEFYFQRLNEGLRKAGLPEIQDGVYVDYKEAALTLDNSRMGDPAVFREIAEQAARDADHDLRNYVETTFPETMYLMSQADRSASWINISYFPGDTEFTAHTTEALNAYRAREMRSKALSQLAPIDIIRSYIQRGQNAINYMRSLAANTELMSKGILKANGNFNITTATIMRSIKGATTDQKIAELRLALAANFGSTLNLSKISDDDLINMIKLYEDMDALALPLRNSDVMGQFNETIGVLGGDGIKAGAHDLIEKGDALIAHADQINATGISDQARVIAVQAALKEGDENATKIIRSAPEIAREAIQALPEAIKKRIGYQEVLTSGDDSIVVASALNDLAANPTEFNSVMLQIADNLSKAKRQLTMTHNGQESTREIGSEVLRFFGGSNKKIAEEAEKAMKPIEDLLGKADFLGPTWRDDFPELGMAIWRNTDGSHEIYINGDSVNSTFKDAIRRVTQRLRRDDSYRFHID